MSRILIEKLSKAAKLIGNDLIFLQPASSSLILARPFCISWSGIPLYQLKENGNRNCAYLLEEWPLTKRADREIHLNIQNMWRERVGCLLIVAAKAFTKWLMGKN